jgi:CPA2 family monovalent cation:H+ antiporter-2
MGLVILLAFSGAVIAHRFGQSMMLAYIIVGILIGPYGPLPWKLVSVGDLDGGFISIIGQIGLVMLMFFVGLEFYPSKIREIGKQAAILAAADMGVTMLVGLAVCAQFGMTLIDSVFISSIISMSSVAVTMKVLDELGWQGSKAAQALIGLMVIEDFAFIILITAGNGIIIGPAAGEVDLAWTIAAIAIFLSFFLVLIFVFVPSALTHIENFWLWRRFFFQVRWLRRSASRRSWERSSWALRSPRRTWPAGLRIRPCRSVTHSQPYSSSHSG